MTTGSAAEWVPKVAAVRHDGSTDADALLWAVAGEQRDRGRRVCGLLMTYPEGGAECNAPMVLVDLAGGERYPVSQALGKGSSSCRADTQGFARASEVLRKALLAQPDLVLVNRFGSLEAEGGGFCAELLELMAAGIPLLTAVAPRYEAAWDRFTGGVPLLAPSVDAVRAWIEQSLAGDGTPATPGGAAATASRA